ncbi:MAG: hypothetical protein WCI12_06195 [Actinomycetes bacterium]
MVIAYLAAFSCALFFGLGSVLQSVGAKRVAVSGTLNPRTLAKVAVQIPYLMGLGIDTAGWLLSLVALATLPVFVVQALVAASVGFVVVFSALIEHLRPNRRQVGVLIILGLGLIGLAISGAPESAKRLSSGFTIAMFVAAIVIAVAGVATPRIMKAAHSASVLAGLAGLAFGGTALCARSLSATSIGWHSFLEPLTWALAAFGIMGLVFFAAALQRGSATVAMAWLCTAETVAPAIIGIAVLGDRARPGLGLLAAVSFVVAVASAVALSLVSPPHEAPAAVSS